MSTIYKTWQKRIESNVFTKGQCGQWAQAVIPLSEGITPIGHRTNLSELEATDLRQQMWDHGGVRITPEHAEAAAIWLKRYGHKVLGIPKDMIAGFDHFEFHGDASIEYSHVGRVRGAYPWWRLYANGFEVIEYYRVPWQAIWDHNSFPGLWQVAADHEDRSWVPDIPPGFPATP